MLVKSDLLDPRPATVAAETQIFGAVNIPADELAERIFELPPKHELLRLVAGVEGTCEASAILRASARHFELVAHEPGSRNGTVPFDFVEPAAVRRRLWSPNEFLAEVLPRIAQGSSWGRALDLACGSGRDAVFMAACGLDVLAVDRLPDAIALGQDLERRYAPICSPPIEWMAADLRSSDFNENSFDLVSMFFFSSHQVLGSLARWLKPGGHAVIETFSATHREVHGKPASAERVLRLQDVPDLAIVEHDERWTGDRHTVRILARRGNHPTTG